MFDEDDDALRLDPRTADVFKKKGYEVTQYLNKGAYGKVYKGFNVLMGVPVAIKAVQLEKVGKHIAEKFFPRELDALKNIKHDHVVVVYDIIRANNVIYIFMEFANNSDIRCFIKKNGALKENLAGFWFAQISEALCYAHENLFIAHRDIKESSKFKLLRELFTVNNV